MEQRIVSIRIKTVNRKQKFGYKITSLPTGSSLSADEFKVAEFSISWSNRSVAVSQGKLIAAHLNNEQQEIEYLTHNLF